jgi:hypothetical protein
MRIITKTILTLSILGSVSVANAGVVQVWECTLKEGNTADDVMKVSAAWVAAAKGMKGGENLTVYHNFPLAAEAGTGRFNFVMIGPDLESWGVFMGGYPGSDASKADEDWNEVAECSGSSLWVSVKVE